MEKPSQAKTFFDNLFGKTSNEAFLTLAGMVETRTSESHWLEFKAGAISGDDLKDKWSKALSAFANTDGGVIIFGIVAKRNAEQIDVATELALVSNPQAIKTRLDQLNPGAVVPPVQGIQIECIVDPANPTQGFVVAFIPESSWKPHRAEFSKNHYYLRTGGSSNPMSPGTLRYLFYPQKISHLVSTIRPVHRKHVQSTDHFDIEFHISLQNVGSHTAQDLFVIIHTSWNRLIGFDHLQWNEISGYNGTALEACRPLHPGARISAGVIPSAGITCDNTGYCTNFPQDPKFELSIYIRDQNAIYSTVSFNQEEIEQKLEKETVIQPLPRTEGKE